jgi:hypothetical protein
MAKPDPTKDPEFQKVIRHFLTTPPKPRKSLGKKDVSQKNERSKKQPNEKRKSIAPKHRV